MNIFSWLQLMLYQAPRVARAHGKLRIFLGYAAGVGKTFAMLEAAHQRKAEGVNGNEIPAPDQRLKPLTRPPENGSRYPARSVDVGAGLAHLPVFCEVGAGRRASIQCGRHTLAPRRGPESFDG